MEEVQRQFVIGMAGHIDHGKTALIEALTGINTDRLKEEKERGITVDLGFAHLSKNVTIIDVPGHERLIKNMVAGVSTIDLVLFVVAADDGIMPQTREHLDIVTLLNINSGIFVITKIDLVEKDWVNLVEEELRDMLRETNFRESPIIKASAVNKIGIEEVRNTIYKSLSSMRTRKEDGIFRIPIDRVFSKAGFGSIITGSVISGRISVGDHVEILPEKIPARIRGLQSHDVAVDTVKAGYRAALNLTGIDRKSLYRGQVITIPGYYEAVKTVNVKISLLNSASISIKNQTRVRIHIHTTEVLARVLLFEVKELIPGESTFAQLKLENSIYASHGDLFIIRQYSPQVTLGGGIILETNPIKFRKKYCETIKKKLVGLFADSVEGKVVSSFSTIDIKPLAKKDLQVRTGLSSDDVEKILLKLEKSGKVLTIVKAGSLFYLHRLQLDIILLNIQKQLTKFHQTYPGRTGMLQKELKVQLQKSLLSECIDAAISHGLKQKVICLKGEQLALTSFRPEVTGVQQKLHEKIEQLYQECAFAPPSLEEVREKLKIPEKEFREIISFQKEKGNLIFIDEKLLLHQDAMKELIALVKKYFRTKTEMSVPDFKDIIQSTRKYAIPFLTYLDNKGYTMREGNVRVKGPKLD